MFLNEEDFSSLVSFAPVISIDICVIQNNSILLGRRNNPPAQNYYFVPGGRIFKNESINLAFQRILKAELGLNIKELQNKEFIGVFEHHYKENFLGNEKFNSHYVVLAYKIILNNFQPNIKDQHSEYIWFNKSKDCIENFEKEIHPYTIDYIEDKEISYLLN